MKLLVTDAGDTTVGIFGGDIWLDLGEINLDSREDMDNIKDGFIRFLKAHDLIEQLGSASWEED